MTGTLPRLGVPGWSGIFFASILGTVWIMGAPVTPWAMACAAIGAIGGGIVAASVMVGRHDLPPVLWFAPLALPVLVAAIVVRGPSPFVTALHDWRSADAECLRVVERVQAGEHGARNDLLSRLADEQTAWAAIFAKYPSDTRLQRQYYAIRGGAEPRQCMNAVGLARR